MYTNISSFPFGKLMNTSLGNYDYIENCIGLYCKGYYLCDFDYIMFTAIALRFLVADVGEPTRRWLLEMTTWNMLVLWSKLKIKQNNQVLLLLLMLTFYIILIFPKLEIFASVMIHSFSAKSIFQFLIGYELIE